MRENRSQIIAAHVALALSRSSIIERTYAQQVVDLYFERTPLHARVIKFHVSSDAYADSIANCQIVRRLLNGTLRMPVDAEEALILALPDPFQSQLLAELADRLGLLAAPQPQATPAGQQHQLGELVAHMGDALQRLSPMLDDGRLDEGDAQHAEAALREIDALMAHCVTMKSAIQQHVLHAPMPLRSVG